MMNGGVRSEGSVQFSLTELMKLEDERIAAEEAASLERQKEAERRAKTALAEAEKKRVAEEEERARRLREEEARREAIKLAAIEQARLEVEANARALEREREHRRELELAAQRASELASKKPTTPSIGMLFGCAMLGGIIMLAVLL